jgi:ubiquinone/menaquinone biosynthesis C-methylase UbiE
MKKTLLDIYVCPYRHTRLALHRDALIKDKDIIEGEIASEEGMRFYISAGIPNFLHFESLSEIEKKTQKEYDDTAGEIYENSVDWLFESLYENEDAVREKMIDLLELTHDAKVLEIGCGTGRDSFRIAKRLGGKGILFLQDISKNMVLMTQKRLEASYNERMLFCELNYFVSTATYLPFPDKYFDAIFHFGGFNEFNEPQKTLKEFARIVKLGGKIVFGDDSIGQWLKGTEFEKIITTNNPRLKHNAVPLQYLPENSYDVTVRWILGGCFYLVDFRVGEGIPALNLDLPHKGWRGGTMRTRYYGQLEGVTPETKRIAIEAAKKSGISVHEWLDKLVRKEAERILNMKVIEGSKK